MGTRDEYIESMKSAFVTLATQSTLAWFAIWTKGVSNTWLLNNIIKIIFKNLFEFIATQSELAIFFKYIDTRIGRQSIDFQNAAMINLAAQQSGTKEQKLEAEKNLIFHFNNFAKLNS